jgi:hypothetical protein
MNFVILTTFSQLVYLSNIVNAEVLVICIKFLFLVTVAIMDGGQGSRTLFKKETTKDYLNKVLIKLALWLKKRCSKSA